MRLTVGRSIEDIRTEVLDKKRIEALRLIRPGAASDPALEARWQAIEDRVNSGDRANDVRAVLDIPV